jgi:hypothetical protein
MKLLSWDQQLGLASPRPYAANQNVKTQTPSKNETGLDASRHTQVSAEGAEKNFLLDMDECNRLFYKRGCQEHSSTSAGSAVMVRGIQSLVR